VSETNGTLSYQNDEGTFTPFASIVDFTLPRIAAAKIDATQPGTPDFGRMDIVICTAAANLTLILLWIKGQKINTFQATTDDYQTVVKGWVRVLIPLDGDPKDKTLKFKLTIHVTDIVELTSVTPA